MLFKSDRCLQSDLSENWGKISQDEMDNIVNAIGMVIEYWPLG